MSYNIFIDEIKINELRHLKNVTIPIVKKDGKLKHLILTGKNGSGKTTLLEAIGKTLDLFVNASPALFRSNTSKLMSNENLSLQLNRSIDLVYSLFETGSLILSYFKAHRKLEIENPNSIEKVHTTFANPISYQTSKDFLKYLVYIRSILTDAAYTNDKYEVEKLEKWFVQFENTLKVVFNDQSIKLKYYSEALYFYIEQKDRQPYSFNSLSDGYASFLNILMELILRMETKEKGVYNVSGIVLIDEIETHLHIELQKSILPFLTSFFPNVQFIVTTHSPFILNSIENAVVYDLENNIRFEDASELSYSSLIKNYFLVDSEYSLLMEKKIKEFEALIERVDRTDAEDEKLADLLVDLKTLSPLLSPEMYIRFQQAQKKIIKKTTTGN